MNSGVIATFAALSGSVIGALGSSVGTWIAQKHHDARDLLSRQLVSREALYSDFIAESARLMIDALEHSTSDPQKLMPVYALLSRIRLSSSSGVLEKAEEVIRTILTTYAKPNLTAEQLHSLTMTGEDLLKPFSDTCRIELESLQIPL
jgi:hypothetical protein